MLTLLDILLMPIVFCYVVIVGNSVLTVSVVVIIPFCYLCGEIVALEICYCNEGWKFLHYVVVVVVPIDDIDDEVLL